MKNTPILFVLGAALALAACSDSPSQPAEPQVSASHAAYVELENGHFALYVQGPTDVAARRVHFDGTAGDLPNNDPYVPKLADANIIAMRSPRWSPDGSMLAFVVSTAFDQAEVAVINADGTHARVVSVNSQYVMGDVDWSADGKLLAYAMSTRSHAQGLELFVSDLSNNTVRQVTQGSGYSGVGGVVRFDASAGSIYFSKVTAEEPSAPYNWITDIRRVSVNGGTIQNVATGIIGNVQAIERSGTGALVMRNMTWSNTTILRDLLHLRLADSGERVLASGTSLQVAHVTQDDSYVVLLTQSNTGTSYFYHMMPIDGGTPVLLKTVGDGTGGMDVRLVRK